MCLCLNKNLEILNALPRLLFGLFLASLGTVIMIHAGIGLFPWGTLNAGLAHFTQISFGVWSQIIGLVLIVVMAFFKHYPGLGTLIDVFFVGFFIDWIEATGFIPWPNALPVQIVFSVAGLFILSYGMALYMSCGLGAGPRDGLMLLVMKVTGRSVTVVKASIEITVTLLGLAFGGPLGLGTVLLAVLGGKVLDWVFQWTGFDASVVKQRNLIELFES